MVMTGFIMLKLDGRKTDDHNTMPIADDVLDSFNM